MTCQIDQEAGQRLDNLTQRSSKPRVRWMRDWKSWVCNLPAGHSGHGATPYEAWVNWADASEEYALEIRIPVREWLL